MHEHNHTADVHVLVLLPRNMSSTGGVVVVFRARVPATTASSTLTSVASSSAPSEPSPLHGALGQTAPRAHTHTHTPCLLVDVVVLVVAMLAFVFAILVLRQLSCTGGTQKRSSVAPGVMR